MATQYGSQLSATPHKRRKIRKGTQSCWECKRRKMRCTFTNADPVCNACQRRGSACVSQDLPDPEEHAGLSLTAKLSQMESSIEALTRVISPLTPDATPAHQHAPRVTSPPTQRGYLPDLTPIASTSGLAQLSCQLMAAWPIGGDLAKVLALPVSSGPLLHAALACTPPSSTYYQSTLTCSTSEILQTPKETWHPVMIARSLFILAIFLDCGPSSHLQPIKVHALKAVQTCFSGDSNLLGSIEGVECIYLLSESENLSGNLRRSWLSNRRAIALAQMMGLDRCKKGNPEVKRSIKFVDQNTRNRVDLEYIWFRLVMLDRYLCLMLGLPPATTDNHFATPEVLAACTPVERLERLQCAAGGLMLQRENCTESMTTTDEIDKMLQQAAACMPAQWWLMPTQKGKDLSYQDRLRIMHHFAQFYLLGQAHLPYLLSPTTDSRHNCSKITAINASREILSRFVAFDESDSPHHCHGIGFLNFVAITALCVAHIDARRRGSTSGLDFLSHQRLGDRGLMELALDRIKGSERPSAVKVVEILENLLTIEADSADGNSYNTSSSPNSDGEDECSGKVDEAMNRMVRIHIPYLGTVEIRRAHDPEPASGNEIGSDVGYGQISVGSNWETPWTEDSLLGGVAGIEHLSSQNILPSLAAGVDDWEMQGVDMALFDRLIRSAEDPVSHASSWLHLLENNSV